MTGTVITKKGVALIAKLLATEQQLTFTRAAVGTGSCPSGYDPASMLDLGQYRMDGMIAGCEAEGEEATVTFQISSEDVEEGFIITEAGLFASDADEDAGEILYAYLDLTDDPQYVYAKGGVVQKFAEIDFKTVVGSVKNVTATISPTALVTKKEYDALEARTAAIETPELNIPEDGEVEGISSFPDFLSTMVSKIPLVQILRNAYAGFQFVLHVGHIVNNCTSEAADLPLAAKQGKVLMDMVTKLNSDIFSNQVSDLNAIFNSLYKISFHTWTPETLHTPYSEGVSIFGNGIAIGMHIGGWCTQIALPTGDPHIYIRTKDNASAMSLWSRLV